MAPVQGRVSSYVSIENGAASPGRWQLWQCFCRIGATSFVNVGAFILPICEQRCAVEQTANSKAITVRFIASRPLPRLEFLSSEPAQRSYQESRTIPCHIRRHGIFLFTRKTSRRSERHLPRCRD